MSAVGRKMPVLCAKGEHPAGNLKSLRGLGTAGTKKPARRAGFL